MSYKLAFFYSYSYSMLYLEYKQDWQVNKLRCRQVDGHKSTKQAINRIIFSNLPAKKINKQTNITLRQPNST